MGTHTSKKPTKKRNKPPNNQDNLTDYHCYSCNISSEEKIEYNNIFKELLYTQSSIIGTSSSLSPHINPSHFNSILSDNLSPILHYAMVCASVITEINNRETSLNYITSFRFEDHIGQLNYYDNDYNMIIRQKDINEKVYYGYKEIENEANDTHLLRNYLMNDTISTRNESKPKVRVKVINIDKKSKEMIIANGHGVKSQSPPNKKSKHDGEKNKNKNSKGIFVNSPCMTVSNEIKHETNTAANKKQFKPKVKVIFFNEHSKRENEFTKENNKIKQVFQSQKVQLSNRNNTIKVTTIPSNNNVHFKATISPLHISDPIQSIQKIHNNCSNSPNNNTKIISKSPDSVIKKPNNKTKRNNNNLNIYIQEINVFNNNNNNKQSKLSPSPLRSKSNDVKPSSNKQKQIINCVKMNLTKILANNSNSNETKDNNSNNTNLIHINEKNSITSPECNFRDIRRIDTPKFNHEHKRSLSSNHLMDFYPNDYHSNINEQPMISGEKFSFKRNVP